VKHAVDELRFYDGRKPEHVPAYSYADASRYLGIPDDTIRAWFRGTSKSGEPAFLPVLELADRSQPFLSFENLVEAHVLGALRRHHRIKMRRVRDAIAFIARAWGTSHPLARKEMLTDGCQLLVEEYPGLVSASEGGQLALRRILDPYLQRIERDPAGAAIRLFPPSRRDVAASPRVVCIDPSVQFGRPCIIGSGIPTEEIHDRWQAGDPVSEIARDFDRPIDEVEEAVRYEDTVRGLLATRAA